MTKLTGCAVLVVMVCSAASARAQSIEACISPNSGEIKAKSPCNPGWTAVTIPLSAPSPGGKLVAEHTWTDSTTIATSGWTDVVGSSGTGTTAGGPLLIVMKLTLAGSGMVTCQPVIDGVWAGQYGGLADPGDPAWHEGLEQAAAARHLLWAPSRVYPSVPAGSHTFKLQCFTSNAFLVVGASSGVASSMSIIELK